MTEGSRASPAPPYPAPIRSNSEMHHFSSEKQSPVHKQPQSLAGSNEQYQEQSSLPPEVNYTVGKDKHPFCNQIAAYCSQHHQVALTSFGMYKEAILPSEFVLFVSFCPGHPLCIILS